jgi:hypothetical protein
MCSGVEAHGGGPDRRGGSLPLISDREPSQESGASDRMPTIARSSVEVQRFVRHSGQPRANGSGRGSSERWQRAQAGLVRPCRPSLRE